MGTAIELIRKNFGQEKKRESESDDPGKSCTRCGNAAWWQAVGGDAWRCEICEPPPRESLVGDRRGENVRYVVEEIELGCSVPQCKTCGCRRTIETVWNDGTVEERCWTCQASI